MKSAPHPSSVANIKPALLVHPVILRPFYLNSNSKSGMADTNEFIRAASAVDSNPKLSQVGRYSFSGRIAGESDIDFAFNGQQGMIHPAASAYKAQLDALPKLGLVPSTLPAPSGDGTLLQGYLFQDPRESCIQLPGSLPHVYNPSVSFFGWIKDEHMAIRVLEYCRIHNVRRCKERPRDLQFYPGQGYIYDTEESQLQRWTDNLKWGDSLHPGGRLMLYREVEPVSDGRSRRKSKRERPYGMRKITMADPLSNLRLVCYFDDYYITQADSTQFSFCFEGGQKTTASFSSDTSSSFINDGDNSNGANMSNSNINSNIGSNSNSMFDFKKENVHPYSSAAAAAAAASSSSTTTNTTVTANTPSSFYASSSSSSSSATSTSFPPLPLHSASSAASSSSSSSFLSVPSSGLPLSASSASSYPTTFISGNGDDLSTSSVLLNKDNIFSFKPAQSGSTDFQQNQKRSWSESEETDGNDNGDKEAIAQSSKQSRFENQPEGHHE